MGAYLTIPGVVESETLHSFQREADGLTFDITFDIGPTATELMHAAQTGSKYDLVVLTTDGGIIALDDVYVASLSLSGSGAAASLLAREVRFV